MCVKRSIFSIRSYSPLFQTW